MSISETPEKALKVLLARLDKSKEPKPSQEHPQGATTENADIEKLKCMKSELSDMKDAFAKINNWEETVMKQLRAWAQKLDEKMLKDWKKMESHGKKLEPIEKLKKFISVDDKEVTSTPVNKTSQRTEDDRPTAVSQEWVDLRIEGQIFKSEVMLSLAGSFNRLVSSHLIKMCLLCLSIFPESSVIKKRSLIYWWIGEGIVTKKQDKTAEEVGEQVFQWLLNEGFISRPSGHENKSPSVNSFIVEPWIRRVLILMAKENEFLMFTPEWTLCNRKRRAFFLQGNELSYSTSNTDEKEEDVSTVFNVNEQFLGSRLLKGLTKLKKVEVLQMGRWQNSVTHHIEVENQRLLIDGLNSKEHLKYLSLRGISGIETLPSSISKLISLQILDLRACHNLEMLPASISELKNLTHLDMSECYLLESMPKGLDQLSKLQVLKGFVVGNAGKSSSKISDLARLAHLRKLSVRICGQGEYDQLRSLDKFPALRILKISWGVILSAQDHLPLSLPQGLLKLDLECVPFEELPVCLKPSKLPNLEKLYINGGRLKNMEHKDSHNWIKIKFLRLRNLKKLEIDEQELESLFPEYLYLEKIRCGEKLDSDIILNKAG